jgi:hypothetical protein
MAPHSRESGFFPEIILTWRSALRFHSPAPGEGCGALRLREGARQEFIMVKERKHGNREAKKPKAAKPPAAPTASSMLTGSLTPIKPIKKAH